MNITFVYPDHESLGIQSLMALSSQNRHSVQLILYCTVDNYHSTRINSPRDLLSNVFYRKERVDVNYEDIAQKIIITKPDLIAFSCVTDNFKHQLMVAKACKSINPEVPTIFGGIHVTSLPEHVIKYSEVDAICIGEAEISFIEFLHEGLRANSFSLPDNPIEGIVIKKQGKYIGSFKEGKLAELDSLPVPDKSLWKSHPGLEYMKSDYKLMTSRGCPYHCSYCCNDMLYTLRKKTLIRRRSVTSVIEELCKVIKHDNNIKTIHFWDDCFTSDKNWLKIFAKEYKTQIALPFQCLAIPQITDAEIVDILADTGCTGVQMGVQSLSASLNKEILFRPFDLEKITRAIESFNNKGVRVFVDQILGIPGDSIKNQEEAILFYNKVRPFRIHALWLTYYPKTKITDISLERGILSRERHQEILDGQNCTSDKLVSAEHVRGELKKYIPVSFMLKYIPVLPKWMVLFLMRTKLYKMFAVRNYTISTLLSDYIKTSGGWMSFFKLCILDLKKHGIINITLDAGKGIIVTEATYGWNCRNDGRMTIKQGNVTDVLRRKLNGRKNVAMKVDVNELSDPAPGMQKDLSITWSYAEDHDMKSYQLYLPPEAHGQIIKIPSFAGK